MIAEEEPRHLQAVGTPESDRLEANRQRAIALRDRDTEIFALVDRIGMLAGLPRKRVGITVDQLDALEELLTAVERLLELKPQPSDWLKSWAGGAPDGAA